MQKILFLDVDGPLIPTRMHMEKNGVFFYDNLGGGYYRWDPNVVAMLNEHCLPQNIKLVWNSCHNEGGPANIKGTAIANGINPVLFHDDICTRFPLELISRKEGIFDWLGRNIPPGNQCKWIVIDDYKLDLYHHQVKVELFEGLDKQSLIKMFDDFMHNDEIIWPNNIS